MAADAADRPARVLIVDDSRASGPCWRRRWRAQDGLRVAGSVFSGEKALEFLRAAAPDVVTLDVEMPGMGGLETLVAVQRFNAGRPPGAEVGVVMVSAFTRQGADVTVRALQAGAFDFVTKPSGPSGADSLAALRGQLVPKIRLFLARRRAAPPPRRRRRPPRPAPPRGGARRGGCRRGRAGRCGPC